MYRSHSGVRPGGRNTPEGSTGRRGSRRGEFLYTGRSGQGATDFGVAVNENTVLVGGSGPTGHFWVTAAAGT